MMNGTFAGKSCEILPLSSNLKNSFDMFPVIFSSCVAGFSYMYNNKIFANLCTINIMASFSYLVLSKSSRIALNQAYIAAGQRKAKLTALPDSTRPS